MRAHTALLLSVLWLHCAVSEVYAVRGVWRIYNTTDCSDTQSLIGLVVVAESTLLERTCSQISYGSEQYGTFSTNTDGFDLQSFARAGSGWDIHMVFNTSNCGVFYDTIYIGKTGTCLNYVIDYNSPYQSFMFAECDQSTGTTFYNYANFYCSGYDVFEQVQAKSGECVSYAQYGQYTTRTTYCNGASAPFSLTPFTFSTSTATNRYHGLYWNNIVGALLAILCAYNAVNF